MSHRQAGNPFDLRLAAAGAILAGLSISPALAVSTLPGQAQPGRSELPITATGLTPLSTTTAAPAPEEAKITAETGASFVLKGIEVSGSTVFSETELEAVYTEWIGQSIDASIVFDIAARLTAYYRDKGYILSQVIVPPQEIAGGVAKLQAIEGYVDNLVIDGTLGSKRILAKSYLDHILGERPLRAKTLERYLLLVGDLAGVKVESVFSPSTDNSGAATLTVRTSHDWFEGSFAYNNGGSDAVGPDLGELQLVLNSVLGQHERIAVKLGVAAQVNELQVGEVYAAVPVGAEGTNIYGRYTRTHSNPGGAISALQVDSVANRYSVGVKHPFIRSRRENLFGEASFDWDDLNAFSNGGLGTISDDHLRVLRLGGEFDFVDTVLGAPAVTAMRGKVNIGLSAFGATTSSAANPSRLGADGQFVSLTGEIQRTQQLGNSGLSVMLAAQGQWANESLLASEEFGFGGLEFGRGYDASQITGDRGAAVKAELRYNGDPGALSDYLDSWQLYSFFDYGLVENVDFDGLGNNATQSLWSAGVGTRLGLFGNTDVDLTLAYRGSPTASVQNLGNNQFRALAQLETHF